MSSTREHVLDNIPFYKAYDKEEYHITMVIFTLY